MACSCPELTGTWWRDRATLRAVLDQHEGPTDAASAHGAIQSTLSVWSRRHGFPPMTPGGKVKQRVLPAILEDEVPWGHGEARLVKPATKEATELVVFVSDLHFPYHDPGAVASALELVGRLQPHRLVINGDVGDFFQLSRFNQDGTRSGKLREEIDQGNAFREAARQSAPNAVIDEVCGNHDSRIRTWIAKNAGELKDFPELQPQALFKYSEYEINGHPGAGFRLRPEFLVKHGTIVRKGAGATAKAEFMTAGISGISGHTHRLATFRQGGYAQRVWMEQGCLCRLDPDYVTGRPDWSQGCAVGEFSTKTSHFQLHEASYMAGKIRLGREEF